MAIVGEPLDDYVIKQIKVRQKLHGSLNRTPDEISILNSQTSYLKLASAISVSKERLKEIGLPENLSGYELAKQFILFSGVSSLKKNEEGYGQLFQRDGFVPQGTGQNSSYTAGQFGYSPMPGLESADIQNLNRGSIKKATVKLVAHNVEQFQIIDLLYLRLGYTVLLEWGHNIYPKNPLNDSDPISRGIKGHTLIESGFYSDRDFNKILKKIKNTRERYFGNYDGFIAKVSNFQWDFKEDGSYDITLTLISLGDVIESLKSNLSPDLTTRNFISLSSNKLNLNPPTAENDESDSDPIEDNKLTSIVHSMLYIWKWIYRINGNRSDQKYITINNETTIGWSQFLENEPKKELVNEDGKISISATSYDIIVPYRLEYKTLYSGELQDRSEFFPKDKDEFNNKQRYKGKVGPFDFSTYDGGKGLPMIEWNFSREFNGLDQSITGYVNFYRYAHIPGAIQITETDPNPEKTLKNAFNDAAYSIAKEFENKIDGFGWYFGSKSFTFSNLTALRGAFPVDENGNEFDDVKYYYNFDKPGDGGTNGGQWGGDGFYARYHTYSNPNGKGTENPNAYKNIYSLQPDGNKFVPVDYEANDGKRGANNMGLLNFDGRGVFNIFIPTFDSKIDDLQISSKLLGEKDNTPMFNNALNFRATWIKESDLSSSDSGGGTSVSGGTTTINLDNPIKDAERKDAFVIGSKTPQYYLRFGYLLKYIRKNILPRVKLGDTHEDNPPIFDIDFDVYKSICFSPPNQMSFDLKTCAVSNDSFLDSVQSLRALAEYRLKDYTSNIGDFPKCDPDFTGATMNIYLNFEFIISSLSEDANGNVSVFTFIKNLCTGINKAMGGVNNLEPIIDEDNNILRIIDTTPIPGTIRNVPSKHNDYKLQVYGYDPSNTESTFLRNFNLKTTITPEFATMVTVGATAGGYTKGIEATAFSKWNVGLVDRYKKEFTAGNKQTVENSTSGSGEDEAITNFKTNFQDVSDAMKRYGFTSVKDDDENSTSTWKELNDSVIKSNLSVATEYFKYTIAKESGENGSGGMIGFIPFKLNFEMDGLSGMKIYNKLTVDTRVLPAAYRDQLDLIVTGIKHKISNQDWVTSIETTVIPNSNPKKPNIAFTPTNNTVGTTSTRGGNTPINTARSVSSCLGIPSRGISKKVRSSDNTDEKAIGYVINNLEGGYFHPLHAWSNNGSFNSSFDYRKPKGSGTKPGNSGETLWGIDRPNGNHENDGDAIIRAAGIAFWKEVDRQSGFGKYSAQNKTVKKYDWKVSTYPKPSNYWKWNYKPNFTSGSVLAKNAQVIIKSGFERNMKNYFGSHPLNQIVRNDGRLLFMYYRAWWNGPGWFKKFATNLKAKYDSGITNTDQLICEDLAFRWNAYSPKFWRDGISKMKDLIDFNPPTNPV